MKNFLKSWLGFASVLLVGGCASGPSHECGGPQHPPPPPPPPCGCEQQGRPFEPGATHPFGSGGMREHGRPGSHRDGADEETHEGGAGLPRLPPPETFDACLGKTANDVCLVQRDGWEMTGVCRGTERPGKAEAPKPEAGKGERLVCAPAHPKEPAEGASGVRPNNDGKPKK
jgi:hypothetical protein